MGAYLKKPITDKHSESGAYDYCGRNVIFASTAMQGWRISMEDAHKVVPHFDKDSSLFAVYDGHGGKEVAVYCADKMGDLIKSTQAYKNGDVPQALKDAFIECDESLLSPEVGLELKKINGDNEQEEHDSESEENIEELLAEANMPLRALMERYDRAVDVTSEGESGSGPSEEPPAIRNILQMLCEGKITLHGSEEPESDSDSEVMNSSHDSSEHELDSANSSHDTSETVDQSNESSALTMLLQTRPGKSVPETSKMADIANDRTPVTIQAAARSEEIAETSNDDLKNDSITKTSETAVQSSPADKPRGLKDLLIAGVEDKYNPDGSPVTELGTKRPHPEDEPADGDPIMYAPNALIPKRREVSQEGHESGTTAVVCLLLGDNVFVANAGDSRCVMSSGGKALELSFDHKPTDTIELERIKRAGGRVGPDGRVNRGLNLSRAIGDHFYKTTPNLSLVEQMISPLPDIETTTLDEDSEFIVLACDGIWNCKTSQEVVDYVRERLLTCDPTQEQLVHICESLCDNCMAVNTDNDGTGCDNMTCIIVVLKGLSNKTTTADD